MSEWIKWNGKGVRPVLADQIVEVRMRDGSTSEGRARYMVWADYSDSIPYATIAYRVVENPETTTMRDKMMSDFNEERTDVIGQNGNDGLHYDAVNHPKHYTSFHDEDIEVGCIYGKEDENECGRQNRKIDTNRTRPREEQYAMEVSLRVRERDTCLPAESKLWAHCELRVQEVCRCSSSSHGEDDSKWVCVCKTTASPEGESKVRKNQGAYISDGEKNRAASSAGGGGSPHKCRQIGQQAGEPRTMESESPIRSESFRSSGLGNRDTETISSGNTDPVNHPKHYTSSPAICSNCSTSIECIQITEHMGFNLGNAIKYIWRSDLKGDAIEDLKKAAWYINREIEKREQVK